MAASDANNDCRWFAYDARLLPLPGVQAAGRIRRGMAVWLALGIAWILLLWNDVTLMQWRYAWLGDEGPDGLFRQVVQGFREFGQFMAIFVTIVIILRADRRRGTIVASILIAQFFAMIGYNSGKLLIGRYRPQNAIKHIGALESMQVSQTWLGWKPGNDDAATQSFPSGHSAASFAFAGVLAWFYPKLRGIFFALAAGCALSRYVDAVHWPSDCLIGAMIGYASAWLALHPRAWAGPVERLFGRRHVSS